MVHMRRNGGRPSAIIVGALAGTLMMLAACSGSDSGTYSPPAPHQGAPNQGAPDQPLPSPGVGPEVDADREPQSTFAIDIDTASYNYARRLILDGARPDASTIRPEEFVNAFRQDYPQPSGNGFAVALDGARMPSAHEAPSETRLLRVGLQTRAQDETRRPDAALTFVVDVSGSMSETGRLDLVQDALHTLIDQLRDTDSVAIVAYQSDATVLREMTAVSSRSSLHRAVDALEAGGSTNLEAGLVTGYQVARAGFVRGATNRVILLSDGLANTGNTNANAILAQIREEAAKKIALLGVGVGSEYGDALMERLADEGDGFVTYVSEREQARDLFVHRLPATLTVRALDAKVQVTFDPSTVATYRLIGYENRSLNPEDFRNDRVDGGEVGPGHSVTALYVIRLRSEAVGTVAQARVRWLDPLGREAQEVAATISVSDLAGDFAGASPRTRLDYVAAFFAERLRRSEYADAVSLSSLEDMAEDAYRDTGDQQAQELAELIRRSD